MTERMGGLISASRPLVENRLKIASHVAHRMYANRKSGPPRSSDLHRAYIV